MVLAGGRPFLAIDIEVVSGYVNPAQSEFNYKKLFQSGYAIGEGHLIVLQQDGNGSQ